LRELVSATRKALISSFKCRKASEYRNYIGKVFTGPYLLDVLGISQGSLA
jgi:hypothetical protein